MNNLTYEQLNLLVGIPKLGKKTAKLLLDELGTPKKICNSSVDRLTQIKGLGLKRATHIHKVLTKKAVKRKRK